MRRGGGEGRAEVMVWICLTQADGDEFEINVCGRGREEGGCPGDEGLFSKRLSDTHVTLINKQTHDQSQKCAGRQTSNHTD